MSLGPADVDRRRWPTTAFVHGGRTVNIRALGETESEAEAESGLFADGTAALALALQFSTADILTKVDGKVQADMNTNGGEVVKFEFDPTVPAAAYDERPDHHAAESRRHRLSRPADVDGPPASVYRMTRLATS